MQNRPRTKLALLDYCNKVLTDPNEYELEAIFSGEVVTKSSFGLLMKYLLSTHPDVEYHEPSLNVGINFNNEQYRFEIDTLPLVSQFCKTNRISASKHKLVRKTWVENFPQLRIDDMMCRVNLKSETEIVQHKDEIVDKFKHLKTRTYRFKKRFSFKSIDKLFRYDLTLVKSTIVRNGESIVASGLLNSQEKYEVEIEYIGGAKVSKSTLEKSFMNNILEVYLAMDDKSYGVSIQTQNAILQGIQNLAKTTRFIGPMPISLEQANVTQSEFNNETIFKDYTVTEKADGERCLLYVHTDNHIYRITSKNAVIPTEMTVTSGFSPSVLDAEYITLTRNGNPMSSFAVFDVYFFKGRSVAKLPLLERLHHVDLIVPATNTGKSKFFKKVFYTDIFEGARTILNMERGRMIEYEIDGLIYTPLKNPIGSLWDGGEVVWSGTWSKVFKWKPPETNSIDFCVKFEGQPIKLLENNMYVQRLNLFVRKQQPKFANNRVDPIEVLKNPHIFNTEVQSGNVLFNLDNTMDSLSWTNVPIDDSQKVVCRNGEVIRDNDIVEFVYDTTWIPIRLRRDKTYPNALHVAESVWRSMTYPVTEDIILGKQKLARDDGMVMDDSVYYNRNFDRERSASLAMLTFHNQWIKSLLISKFKGKVKSVFDIACGKGGDFKKYANAGIKLIVGVDKSQNNIEDANDGAYQRAANDTTKRPAYKDVTYAFATADFGIKINDDYIKSLSEHNRRVLDMLWNGNTVSNVVGLDKYKGILRQRFDLVSCQFAIHYFMESETMFDNFLENVSSVIGSDGIFVGTCLDGGIVNAMLAEEDELSGHAGNRLMWKIKKKYDRWHTKSKNFGLKIQVFMETISLPFDEYLVDFDLLLAKFRQYNMYPLTQEECTQYGLNRFSQTFEESFQDNLANMKFQVLASTMSEDEKRYSFMNRWFVLKKHPPKKQQRSKA